MADSTAGFSPRSTARAVSLRVASIMYRLPPMRASASSTPSNLPIGVLNWLRTRAYAPVARTASLAMPVDDDGSEIDAPAASDSISMRQPLPICAWPPITQSIGMKTSLPQFGPFWNTAISGMWRRPMLTPGCRVGISAQVMPEILDVAEQMFRDRGRETLGRARLRPAPA